MLVEISIYKAVVLLSHVLDLSSSTHFNVLLRANDQFGLWIYVTHILVPRINKNLNKYVNFFRFHLSSQN